MILIQLESGHFFKTDSNSPLKNPIQSNPPREQGVLARRIHQSFALADAAGYFFNRLPGDTLKKRDSAGNPDRTGRLNRTGR
jgi:hypothetical protein